VENLITDIAPIGRFETPADLTLRQQMYEAPFIWYPNLEGVDPFDTDAVKNRHLEWLLKPYPGADDLMPGRSGELAIMRLPRGQHLHLIVRHLDQLIVIPGKGWQFAGISEAPIFATLAPESYRFAGIEGRVQNAWCLGSPELLSGKDPQEDIRAKVSEFRGIRVPPFRYPLLCWTNYLIPGETRKKVFGWTVHSHLTHWTRELASRDGLGIPLLLVRWDL